MSIKKIEVTSRANAIWMFGRQYSDIKNAPKTALISISSRDEIPPDFNMDGSNGLLEVCIASFDDEEQGMPRCIEQQDAE